MSTDGTIQPDPTTPPTTGATPVSTPVSTPLQAPPVPEGFAPLGDQQTEKEPGFIARHTTTLITVMVAVIVAAIAIAGVSIYRHNVDSKNKDTEAAFAQMVASQNANLETVECHGGTCAAVINGQAYTVLVQKDSKGTQHFGVSAYAGS